MGQQPNIELEISDLPRPTPAPAPPRRWKPQRPGELTHPDDMPWGGAYGTTGPDAGFALALVRRRELTLQLGEQLHNVETALAAVAAARASRFGRAPTKEDVELAVLLFGYAPDGLPSDLVQGIARDRNAWFANLAHDDAKLRRLIADVPHEVLDGSVDDLRSRMIAGRRGINR